MSLFIGSLAIVSSGQQMMIDERFSIVIVSPASELLGYLILRFSLKM